MRTLGIMIAILHSMQNCFHIKEDIWVEEQFESSYFPIFTFFRIRISLQSARNVENIDLFTYIFEQAYLCNYPVY